ncbi:MAG TPA: BadF/BadG/BcrA/BcrD ATPase family protein, partial [Terriglobales bacterium]|nr:BadF/BadG/BcrA/BcrD ATPase family protein [Terriglobales bacterium]
MGISGAARPEIAEIVRAAVSELLSGPVDIVGDMETALQAAFGDGPGIIANAGTGSFAYGRNRAGKTARIGGWGFAISDEGSGHWIGRLAISAAFRARDDGQPSRLLPEILNAWKLSSPDDLVRAANASPPPDFSTIFPITLAAADAGDSVARSVLTQAGAELARLVKLAMHRLFSTNDDVPVAMTGSVLLQSALVRQFFYNDLRSSCPHASLNSATVEPVKGALELARKAGRLRNQQLS